ncbi:hypothetical protein K438DRAFT_1758971 [Mycena galopus ATCC 62051]|nr:hypothetical protein K438DRAFT_1758971 [Mycena galopus ATCC 62051]
MAPNASDKIGIHVYLLDDAHRLGSGPHLTFERDATVFRGSAVSSVLQEIQKCHRSDCQKGLCSSCTGAIFVKSAWLLDKIPDATAYNTSSRLNHDATAGTQFMEPWSHMVDHIGRSFTGQLFVLCESAFDKTTPLFNKLPEFWGKRQLESSEDVPDSSRKKAKLRFPPHNRLHIISPHDSEDPVNLPQTSFAFQPSCLGNPGTVFIDKTRFIFELDKLLEKAPRCFVALPPQTGKTAFLSMYAAWLDCELSPDERDMIFFEELGIHSILDEKLFDSWVENQIGPIPRKTSLSEKAYMCLKFDLHQVKKFLEHDLAVVATGYIDDYLSRTIQNFTRKYRGRLGNFDFSRSKSPAEMIAQILDRIKRVVQSQCKLFIGMDHWDAPILRALSLQSVQDSDRTQQINAHIIRFITAVLIAVKMDSEVFKFLVFGNLPPLPLDPTDPCLTSLSTASTLDGAFGITPEELEQLFSVLSHNRKKKVGVHEPGKLAVPPLPFGNRKPPSAFNFALVFNHAVTTLELGGKHKTLMDSYWLQKLSQRYEKSLRYSSLRRRRQMVVPPFGHVNSFAVAKDDQNLWALLICLGALVCTQKSKETPGGPTWTLKTCTPFAESQLFAKYPHFPTNLKKVETSSFYPYWSVTLGLSCKLDEAVFQEMWNGFMSFHSELVDAQLHLFTTPTSPHTLYLPLAQTYWYLDIFMCALQALHPGRAIAIELKYISLHNIFRAKYLSDAECHDRVYGTGPTSEFQDNCLKLLTHLDTLPEKDLLEIECHFYHRSPEHETKADGKKTNRQKPGAKRADAPKTSSKVSIGEIVKHGKEQLHWKWTDESLEGILKSEIRVQVTSVPEEQADELIGYVVYGVGRRVLWAAVEPVSPNVKYQYGAKSETSVHEGLCLVRMIGESHPPVMSKFNLTATIAMRGSEATCDWKKQGVKRWNAYNQAVRVVRTYRTRTNISTDHPSKTPIPLPAASFSRLDMVGSIVEERKKEWGYLWTTNQRRKAKGKRKDVHGYKATKFMSRNLSPKVGFGVSADESARMMKGWRERRTWGITQHRFRLKGIEYTGRCKGITAKH